MLSETRRHIGYRSCMESYDIEAQLLQKFI